LSGFPTGYFMDAPTLNSFLLGWFDFAIFNVTTLAYVSADAPTFVFSVNADVTDEVAPGMLVRLTQTTDKFFVVTAVGAFSGGVTQITVSSSIYTLVSAVISSGAFSTHQQPYGGPLGYGRGVTAIYDTTLPVAASSIDITGITALYKNLLIEIFARSTTVATSAAMILRLNNDSGTVYDYQRFYATGATPGAADLYGQTNMLVGYIPAASAPGGIYGACSIEIPNYNPASYNKSILARSGLTWGASAGDAQTELDFGSYRGTSAAVSRLTLSTSGNFEAGTSVTVYAMGT